MGRASIDHGPGNSTLSTVALLVLFMNALCYQAAAVTNSQDVTALEALLQEWGTTTLQWYGEDPCADKWTGVLCDPSDTNVTRLILSTMNIQGLLPPAIGDFLNLVQLEMSFNPQLSGPLPVELGNLRRLESLSLQACSFSGVIPRSLGNLKYLTFLALNGNNLSGELPSALGSLPRLKWFDVSSNKLSGLLPVSTNSTDGYGLDTMQSAMHFHLNNNFFSGHIPHELGTTGSLTNLLHLLLDNNLLTGGISSSLASLSSLQILNLANNRLHDSDAALSEFSQANSLIQLNLANNQLNGILPNLSGLTSLVVLDLSNNHFSSQPFPRWFTSLTNLKTLIMEHGNLTGELPPEILTLPSLQNLRLLKNNLNGTLTIPPVLGGNLTLISLQQNNITRYSDPDNGLKASAQLLIGGNEICNISIYNFSSSQCSLAPDSLRSWSSTGNNCSGKSCSGGTQLNPQSCSCAYPLLWLLELRQPSFSVLTDALMNKLQFGLVSGLNLSTDEVWVANATFTYNGRVQVTILFFPPDKDGRLLTAQMQTDITSSLSQHSVVLLNSFEPYRLVIAPQVAKLALAKKASLSTGAIIGIVLAVAVIGLGVAVVALYAVTQKRRADRMQESQPFGSWGGDGGDNGTAPQLKGARWFSFAELKKATDNFKESNELGAGGYGKVYKATLLTGEVVAVKRSRDGSMQGATQFKNEIELLSRVHHRNLVGLVGFCYEHGEEMLIYEYMPKGTLREHLLGLTEQALPWRRRLHIALGSARGIAYLHEMANPPIIHRDVKSSNILLDEMLVPKVADFGLSKLAPDGDNKDDASMQVKGTLGYLDPEYYMTHQLSDKSDVYSFGVVLLELITARQPIESGKYIVREVQAALNKGGMPAVQAQLIDPFIGAYQSQDLETFLDLALSCVEETAAARPIVSEVVKCLEVLVGHSHPDSRSASLVLRQQENLYDNPDSMLEKKKDASFLYSGGYTVPSH